MTRSASVIALLCIVLGLAAAQIPDYVITLDEETFEHHTQASTGQTAGVWFVLFNTKSSPRYYVARNIWYRLAQDEEKEVILAEVELTDPKNKKLARRFEDIQPPAAALFRDQKMYIYPGALKTGVDDQVREWLKGEFPNADAQEVPGVKATPPPRAPVDPSQESKSSWKNMLFGAGMLLIGISIHAWAFVKDQRAKAAERIAARRAAGPAAGANTQSADPLDVPAATSKHKST